jgi:hypothetical protein
MRMPQNEWFSQVALYWDKVYTLTTSYHFRIWNQYNSYEEKLARYKLVEPIRLSEHTREKGKFNNFLEYVDSSDYPIPHDKTKWKVSVRMFHEKMDWDSEVLRELQERGLVSDRPIEGWYRVEAHTAKQYMAYLAAAIGSDSDINANAITDRQLDLESFVETNEQTVIPEPIRISEIVLKEILPSPAGPVDPELIARFKRNNQEELSNFREYLQDKIRKIASENPEDQKESIEYLIKDEQSNIKGLEEKMRANGWQSIIRNNWKTLAVPLVGVILAPPTGGLSLLSTLIGYETWGIDELYKKKNKEKKFKKDKHFYLVSAKKVFKTPSHQSNYQKIQEYALSLNNDHRLHLG